MPNINKGNGKPETMRLLVVASGLSFARTSLIMESNSTWDTLSQSLNRTFLSLCRHNMYASFQGYFQYELRFNILLSCNFHHLCFCTPAQDVQGLNCILYKAFLPSW